MFSQAQPHPQQHPAPPHLQHRPQPHIHPVPPSSVPPASHTQTPVHHSFGPSITHLTPAPHSFCPSPGPQAPSSPALILSLYSPLPLQPCIHSAPPHLFRPSTDACPIPPAQPTVASATRDSVATNWATCSFDPPSTCEKTCMGFVGSPVEQCR